MAPVSPLRYPGGKGRLAPALSAVFKKLPRVRALVETHAGGAGLGLNFLFNGLIDRLVLNDLDIHIFAFWKSVLTQTNRFMEKIANVTLDMAEWRRQRGIYEKGSEEFDLGFSAFYLNRTNFGGVIDGRPIGGLEQSGKFKLDARFTRKTLIDRIAAVGARADRVRVSNRNAADLARFLLRTDVLVYLDPPYTDKERLYGCSFRDGVTDLADALRFARFPWIMTINDSPEIRELFAWASRGVFTMPYSFLKDSSRKKGQELLIWKNIDNDAFEEICQIVPIRPEKRIAEVA